MISKRVLKNILLSTFVLFFCTFLLFGETRESIFSNSLEDYEKQLEEKKEEKEKTASQLEQVKEEIQRIQNSSYSLTQQIQLIEQELQRVEDEMEQVKEDIAQREKDISEKEDDLEEKQNYIWDITERLYKSSRYSFFEILFRQGNDEGFIQTLIFNRFVIDSQVSYMKTIAEEVRVFQEEKDELEKQREVFEKDQEEFGESKDLLAQERVRIQGELREQEETRGTLTRRIGGLNREISQLQNVLLVMRSGGTVVRAQDLVAGGPSGSIDGGPPGSFGVFSFGAYTHRNGMSQWGARARADDGQSYREILNFYYSDLSLDENYQEPEEITVRGTGLSCECQKRDEDGNCVSYEKVYNETVSFQTYMNRIYEIPPSWNTEVVKAQAVAARTFAIHQHKAKGFIEPSQRDQVYKDCDNASSWVKAVQETKGEVLLNGSNIGYTQYAAVHGGWVDGPGSSKYDVKEDRGDWNANIPMAWDNISGVSWFYRNWYTYRGNTCSTHPNPWLTNEEMADLVNAYLYWSHLSAIKVAGDARLLSVDYVPCIISSTHKDAGNANPYSMAELKEKVRSVGKEPVSRITDVSVSNANGWTQSITFLTDVGAINIDRSRVEQFREAYNMRAPAYFAIPQDNSQNPFVHINIEMN